MKRYDLELTATGPVMEERKEGAYVTFSEVEQLQAKVYALLEERNSTGIAISNAILVGVVPDKHPLRSRLELLANHRKMLIEKSELCDDLLDLIERMVNCMGLAGEEPEKDSYNPIKAWMYDAISTMAGQRPKQSVAVTETIRTAPERIWLQVGDQASDGDYQFPEHHDEVSWCADSVVACEVPYVRADLKEQQADQVGVEPQGGEQLNKNPAATAGQPAPTLNKQPSLTGQVLAGMGAATLLAGLDKESASDVVQLMLEAAEAKGGEPCDSASLSFSPA